MGFRGISNDDAFDLLDRFMASPLTAYRDEPVELLPLWRRLAKSSTAAPRLWMDAYLAAFAIADDLTLITLDKDFASFEQAGLRLLLLQAS